MRDLIRHCQPWKWIVFLLLLETVCKATTAITIVTTEGIVVGEDSAALSLNVRGTERLGDVQPTMTKAFLLKGRFAVAEIGSTAMSGVTYYRLTPFSVSPQQMIANVEAKIQPQTSVSDLVSLVETESLREWEPLNVFIRHEVFHPKDGGDLRTRFPDNRVVEFLIAGYELHDPVIVSLHLDINWITARVEATREQLPASPPVVRGFQRVIRGFYEPGTSAYSRFVAIAPLEISTLVDKKLPSLGPTIELVHVLLKAESDNSPATVAPPFVLIVIHASDSARVIRYEK